MSRRREQGEKQDGCSDMQCLIDPADFVPAGSFSHSAISAGFDLCYISYIGDKQETLFIRGLFPAADIFMLLCIYRKYEADSAG